MECYLYAYGLMAGRKNSGFGTFHIICTFVLFVPVSNEHILELDRIGCIDGTALCQSGAACRLYPIGYCVFGSPEVVGASAPVWSFVLFLAKSVVSSSYYEQTSKFQKLGTALLYTDPRKGGVLQRPTRTISPAPAWEQCKITLSPAGFTRPILECKLKRLLFGWLFAPFSSSTSLPCCCSVLSYVHYYVAGARIRAIPRSGNSGERDLAVCNDM